jgi:hypothetical protein
MDSDCVKRQHGGFGYYEAPNRFEGELEQQKTYNGGCHQHTEQGGDKADDRIAHHS